MPTFLWVLLSKKCFFILLYSVIRVCPFPDGSIFSYFCKIVYVRRLMIIVVLSNHYISLSTYYTGNCRTTVKHVPLHKNVTISFRNNVGFDFTKSCALDFGNKPVLQRYLSSWLWVQFWFSHFQWELTLFLYCDVDDTLTRAGRWIFLFLSWKFSFANINVEQYKNYEKWVECKKCSLILLEWFFEKAVSDRFLYCYISGQVLTTERVTQTLKYCSGTFYRCPFSHTSSLTRRSKSGNTRKDWFMGQCCMKYDSLMRYRRNPECMIRMGQWNCWIQLLTFL